MDHIVRIEFEDGSTVTDRVTAPGEVAACMTAYNAWSDQPDLERVHYLSPVG